MQGLEPEPEDAGPRTILADGRTVASAVGTVRSRRAVAPPAAATPRRQLTARLNGADRGLPCAPRRIGAAAPLPIKSLGLFAVP